MNDLVTLAHGGGGEEMEWLIQNVIFDIFSNQTLQEANDSALLNLNGDCAFSTDSFVVSPIFFSGGDIGKIAACGTINDIAMMGAKPLYLSCSLIIEEGLKIDELRKILISMKQICTKAGVQIVCGDTKVVPRGKCDKIFINTAGIGKIKVSGIGLHSLKDNVDILVSGDIGRHGAVILAAREGFETSVNLKSDCAPLNDIVLNLLDSGIKPLAMRDATRGGVSAVLNEWHKASNLGIVIKESNISISDEVRGICEIFGFEPLELANEGTFILAVSKEQSKNALSILQDFNPNAAIIGEITSKRKAVILESIYGTQRFLEAPKGELLPRIC